MFNMWFFELPTGIYRREDWRSNFYHYRLRNSHPPTDQSTEQWLEENVERAELDSSGLVYDREFVEALELAERDADEQVHRLRRLAPELSYAVPEKIV